MSIEANSTMGRLKIDFFRITENDRHGMCTIDCIGEDGRPIWTYANGGNFHGVQGPPEMEAHLMAFGDKLTDLVKEHFIALKPVCEK